MLCGGLVIVPMLCGGLFTVPVLCGYKYLGGDLEFIILKNPQISCYYDRLSGVRY